MAFMPYAFECRAIEREHNGCVHNFLLEFMLCHSIAVLIKRFVVV